MSAEAQTCKARSPWYALFMHKTVTKHCLAIILAVDDFIWVSAEDAYLVKID
jgi:hypothetical protein